MAAGDELKSKRSTEPHSEGLKGRTEPGEGASIYPGSRDLLIQPDLTKIPIAVSYAVPADTPH